MIEFFKDLAVGVFIFVSVTLLLLLGWGLITYLPAWITLTFAAGYIVWLIGSALRSTF